MARRPVLFFVRIFGSASDPSLPATVAAAAEDYTMPKVIPINAFDHTKHFSQRKFRVAASHIVESVLFQHGTVDQLNRLWIPKEERVAAAQEARRSGDYELARQLERAAEVTMVVEGSSAITIYRQSKPRYLSRVELYRRHRRAAAAKRGQPIR